MTDHTTASSAPGADDAKTTDHTDPSAGPEHTGHPGHSGHPGHPGRSGGDVDVLVVGSGPTGLLAATELLRRGVRVRVIDRDTEPMHVPKALSLWPRAIDVLDDLGLGDGLRKASVRVNAWSYFSERRPLASFQMPAEYASRSLPQYETERLLTERFHALGGKTERGVRLLAVDDIDYSGRIDATDGVTAVLEHHDGVVERVRVPFLIGADGAGSAVRGQLGTGFEGSTYEMAFALVDTHVEGDLPADEIRFYQASTGTLVIVPMPDGVFRFLCVLPSGGPDVSVEMMQKLVDERGPRGITLTDPVWQTVFRVHARHATDFQRGRVFLMGDAAHVHSPAGGQGMNNGLQDAHNLAWKLAAVIHGDSPSSLLHDYGAERAHITRRIVRDTDMQTRAWMAGSRAKVVTRDALFRLAERTGAATRFYAPVMAGRRLAYEVVRATQLPSRRSHCALRGRLPGGLRVGSVFPRQVALAHEMSGPEADPSRWTLVAVTPDGRGAWLDDLHRIAERRGQLRLLPLRRSELTAFGACRETHYYLVRPDGHIAAHGHERDLAHLEAELDEVLLVRSP
ncbi:FAD-dependent monooxygenase [Streptomyces sp. LHD-70]|uniref:FAD-dependent monooxygenase n=1 Tax=Streptomyces sp. LHD-70 TaxID=3072140 RepID=UPI00280FE5C5|nr:FAD-dependent monooxygenase [Streptomyces sp. LHD-70]MDQ8707264.1 FAD-dependent monooxygenase [Streptomyces sp. LHD-70]